LVLRGGPSGIATCPQPKLTPDRGP
jgi:hypothetical protein